MKPITAFVPYTGGEFTAATVRQLRESPLVEDVVLLTTDPSTAALEGCTALRVQSLHGGQTVEGIIRACRTPYSLLIIHDTQIEFGQLGLERFHTVAATTGADFLYSDYADIRGTGRTPHPVIDYQPGSLRDDFDFGSVYFLRTRAMARAAKTAKLRRYRYAGLYTLRLTLSRTGLPLRIAESLYARIEGDVRKSGEKQFDYVNPKNRDVQIEMEQAVTDHLRMIGAYLKPRFLKVRLDEAEFPVEASVIIPVKNRVTTIADAVGSVLRQETTFPTNVIVVDNFSTDGTTEMLRGLAQRDPRIIHIVPERADLGIGGCWNRAVQDPRCGRFAVQLDSDDLYKDTSTLTRVVETFRREKCGMVIGSYQMTNFKLEELPPGIIDHKEWTPKNGRNNALRINGLGAPRAFFTPLLRQNPFPNVSYGEDYAVALAISRHYQIGRVYEPIYLCRRWEGNTDADLDITRLNAFNLYKDRVRTLELLARIRSAATTARPRRSKVQRYARKGNRRKP